MAIALSLWGAATFISASPRIFSEGPQVWSWGAAFLAPGFEFWLILAGLFWFVGTFFFISELLGYTLRKGKLVKQIIKWDSIDVATAALAAAIYGGGLLATAGLVIIPGFTWIRPANMLAPIFGMLFGIPGAVGVAFGNLIADAFGGFFSVGSIGGFIGNFLIAYIPYKFMRDHSIRSSRSVFEYYFWAVIVSSFWVAVYISWWLHIAQPLVGLPPIFIWGFFAPFVYINNSLVTAIAGPIVAYVLYPIVKRWGLYWADRIEFVEK